LVVFGVLCGAALCIMSFTGSVGDNNRQDA
jgi:hypothetical protein